jgi:Cft2 family RNA processing exonuclease
VFQFTNTQAENIALRSISQGSKLPPHLKKISEFPSSHFKIIGYCCQCNSEHQINQDKEQNITLKELRQSRRCPVCEAQGLSFSLFTNSLQ